MVQRSVDILGIGMNDAAMESRKLVLERAGHNVTQARDLREVRAACEARSFDVVVIGQWVNFEREATRHRCCPDILQQRQDS